MVRRAAMLCSLLALSSCEITSSSSDAASCEVMKTLRERGALQYMGWEEQRELRQEIYNDIQRANYVDEQEITLSACNW